MHPSLAVSNLHQLPLLLRRRALAAAAGNIDELKTLNRSQANVTRLLPVYYSGLDTAPIPSLLAQLDAPEGPFLTQKLAQVVLCLQGLCSIGSKELFPGPPSVDLWQRVWPWLEFLDTYQDHLPRLLRPGLGVSDFSPLLLISVLGRDEATAKLMLVTPGLRILIFRAWAQSFDQTKFVQTHKGLFDKVCGLMQNVTPTITDQRDFEEAIEGSGGNRLALARLCVNHINFVVQPAAMSPGDFSMRSVIILLQMRCEADMSFRELLVDQGIVSALTSVACRFSSPPFAQQNSLFILCWAIKFYLRMPYGHKTITEAVHAGLLRALLAFGKMSPPPEPQYLQQLDEILVFFSTSSVYLSFLLQLQASIKELEDPHRRPDLPWICTLR
ncbi:MYND-type domain-containing protein [Mycena sanguinolenta]|uniref:MYND-type domain-containing protein n=1 Tax=Mycena sanguinolenta TaxID=230812 RepID=A0A8H6YRJ9_9AGAR|nr:MYND-type domain-containing protein [Mycena sanguinolenta]